jgi:hypothetical protein
MGKLLPNIRVGGPYTVKGNYVGFKTNFNCFGSWDKLQPYKVVLSEGADWKGCYCVQQG